MAEAAGPQVPLRTIARDWTRIGLTGFGGPPAHVELIRRLVVDRERWMTAQEFEDALAACGLLPGPASTQLAIYCARRVGGPAGAVVGGLGFILPAVVLMLALSALFLSSSPPLWIRGAGAGAGAAVAAVAVRAATGLAWPSWRGARGGVRRRLRWLVYVAAGAVAAATVGPYLVLVLLGCGAIELAVESRGSRRIGTANGWWPLLAPGAASVGGLGSLCWVALKVGALSFGGGFVIVPLMQHDAVHTYHWMSSAAFLNVVALGQVTPGPVVATVAGVGYAAHGVGGGALAAAVAFAPSFLFVLVGGGHFARVRGNSTLRSFLAGAGPAAIGAILGSAIPLAGALNETWQYLLLAGAAVALLALRRGVVSTLVLAGAIGAIVALAGGPVPH
jgi:chromate transporter